MVRRRVRDEDAGQTDAMDDSMEQDNEQEELYEGGTYVDDIYIPPAPQPSLAFDPTGPRLMIASLEIENFKSYFGKQVLGPFHKRFSSIVGPNGSGKSNVIDAMLFVFGYRAQKIRSKKISILIHSSERQQHINCCTVTVHFQKIIDLPGDDFEVVPNFGFSIGRTAFKNNSSQYSISGKNATYKDVAALLRSHGIDIDHNRFLILQGEVEQIALMKPKAQNEHDKGMLELLEDIIGSARLKAPIEMLSNRVELLGEQRSEQLTKVKMIEKEKDELEGPYREAIKFLHVENESVLKQHIILQKKIYDSGCNLEKLKAKKQSVKDGSADLRTKLEAVVAERKERDGATKDIQKKVDSLQKKKEKLHDQFKAFEAEDTKVQAEMKVGATRRMKQKVELKKENQKLVELQEAPANLEKSIAECEAKKAELEANREKAEAHLEKELSGLKEVIKPTQDKKEALETQLIPLKQNVDRTNAAMQLATSELQIFQRQETSEKTKLENLREAVKKNKAELTERKRQVADLRSRLPAREKELLAAEQRLKAIAAEEAALTEETRQLKMEIEGARNALEGNKSRSRLLDALLKEKQNGNLPGIFGRLGDLGAIDAKYDVAISTACGPLDNIIVDTVDTAKACIQFLRDNQLGTSSFIVLDKQQKWWPNIKNKMNTPEGIPRLVDLIKVNNEQILPAFYFALRDTLVAKDLEQATRVGLEGSTRHRVVSLGGDLIEVSGTMSGGGKSVSRGRMGRSVVADVSTVDLKEKEKRLEASCAKLCHLKEEKRKLEQDLETGRQQVRQMGIDLEKFQLDLTMRENQEGPLSKQLADQEKVVKSTVSDAGKVKELQEHIDQTSRAYEQATEEAGEIEKQVQALHKQIVDINKKKVGGAQAKLKEITDLLDKVCTEITRLTVSIKTNRKNAKKTEEKIASLTESVKKAEEEVTALNERKNEIETLGKSLLSEMNKITNDLEGLEDEIKEKKKGQEGLMKQETEMKSSLMEVDQKLAKIKEHLKEESDTLSYNKNMISKLELHDIETDEVGEKQAFRTLEEGELKELDCEALKQEYLLISEKLNKKKPDLSAIQEFKKKEELYLKRVAELDKLTKQREEKRHIFEDLRKQRLNEFMSGFSIITSKLKETYQMITLGGDAELELVDSLDPFSEGIAFSVRPPKKAWKTISNLSGGEKTLSSLALVFALHYYKATPFYFMDEIDAALDFCNVSIIGHYVKDLAKNAQFVVISLRSNMFELAERLIGIFKVTSCSSSVTINPNLIEAGSDVDQ